MNTLNIKNLSITYDKKNEILSNVNLDFSGGNIYGIIGRNGAGKTTFLKSIVNIIKYRNGEIIINGKKNSDFKNFSENVGFMIDPDVSDDTTLKKLITFNNKLSAKKHNNELIDILDISSYMNTKISKLSYGNKQKIALFQALMYNPEIIILDEPLIGLDPVSIENLKNYLLEMRDKGSVILFSNHQINEMLGFCDEYYIVKDKNITVMNLESSYKVVTNKDTYTVNAEIFDDFLKNNLKDEEVIKVTFDGGDLYE